MNEILKNRQETLDSQPTPPHGMSRKEYQAAIGSDRGAFEVNNSTNYAPIRKEKSKVGLALATGSVIGGALCSGIVALAIGREWLENKLLPLINNDKPGSSDSNPGQGLSTATATQLYAVPTPLVASASPSPSNITLTPAAFFVDYNKVQTGPYPENDFMAVFGPSESINQANRLMADHYPDGIADSTNAYATDFMNQFEDSDNTPSDPEKEPGLGFTGREEILSTEFVLDNADSFMVSELVDNGQEGIWKWAFKAPAHDDDASALLSAIAEVYSIYEEIAKRNNAPNELEGVTVASFMQNTALMQMATVIQGRNMTETRYTDDLGTSQIEQQRRANGTDASSKIPAKNRWNDQNVSCNEFQEVADFEKREDQTQNLHTVWNISNGASTFSQSNIDIYYNVFAGSYVPGEGSDTDGFSAYTYDTELDDVSLESVRMEEKHPCGPGIEADDTPTPPASPTAGFEYSPTPGPSATQSESNTPSVNFTSTPEDRATKTPKPTDEVPPTRVATQQAPTDSPPPTAQPTAEPTDEVPPTRVATQQAPTETSSESENYQTVIIVPYGSDVASSEDGVVVSNGLDKNGNEYEIAENQDGEYTIYTAISNEELVKRYGDQKPIVE